MVNVNMNSSCIYKMVFIFSAISICSCAGPTKVFKWIHDETFDGYLPTMMVVDSNQPAARQITFSVKRKRLFVGASVPDRVSRKCNGNTELYEIAVIDFDERTETLKTAGFMSIIWTDELIKWNETDFNNTKYLFVPQDDLWKPGVALENSFKSFRGLGSSFLDIQVDNEGQVTWNPYQVLESTCAVSITYFPFDEQICDLKFTAWSYTKDQVSMLVGDTGIRLTNYVPNPSWDLIWTSSDDSKNSTDLEVIFTVKLKRKPRFDIINIIIPIIFLSILNVFPFVLPVVSGERAGYSITVFLSLAVFLTIVSDQLPKNSETTSIMAVYIMLITGLSTVNVMLCMMQLRLLSWNDTQRPVSKFYRNFVRMRNCFRCKSKNQSVAPEDGPSSAKQQKVDDKAVSLEGDIFNEQNTVTWLDVINAMDFILFFVSFLYTFTWTLVIGVVAVHGGN